MILGYVIIKGGLSPVNGFVEMYAGHSHSGKGRHQPEPIWKDHLATFRNAVAIYDTEAEALRIERMLSKEGHPCDVMPLLAGKPRGTLT